MIRASVITIIYMLSSFGSSKAQEYISYYNLEKIQAFESWKILDNVIDNDTLNIVIAVIDKGVNINHEDIHENLWTNPNEIPGNLIDDDENGFIDDYYGWNFANNTNDVTISGIGNWHGTPVNGIIGAIHNNIGVNGVCTKIKLLNIVKGEDIESIMNSLNYVYNLRKKYNETDGKEGAFIVAINCSWGKASLWAANYPNWCEIYDRLGEEGILCVASAPNANIDVDLNGDMPSTCSSSFLVTVTNTNKFDEKIYDAGYGHLSIDLGAPGENSFTTLNPGGYGYFGGTSAATPYVTGAIGLMYLLPSMKFHADIKYNPKETALLIKRALLEGVDKSFSLEGKTVTGGRLNIFKSLKILSDFYDIRDLYIDRFEELNILSIYPNPILNNAKLTIESNSGQQVNLIVFDMFGHKLLSFQLNQNIGIDSHNIDLSNLKTGIYMLTIFNSKTKKTIKIIVQ